MVDCTGLENQQECKLLVGSNPTLSASQYLQDANFYITQTNLDVLSRSPHNLPDPDNKEAPAS